MKKIKLFALAIMAMLSTNAFAVTNVTHSNGTFTYTYDADQATPVATITGFVAELAAANQQTVSIPNEVYKQDNTTKIKVTAIAADAFKNNKNITTVTIPETDVTTIGSGAFTGCTNLGTVTIGKAVTAIGTGGTNGAFEGCTSLATVNFTARTADTDPYLAIEAKTFAETAIVELDLTNSKVQTLNPLFEELNTTLTTIKLPATLTLIKDGAFKQLTLSTIDWSACAANITIGDGTAGVFDGAPLIKDVTLPAKVVAIAKDALKGSNIQKLTITSSATAGTPTIKEVGATKLTELVVNGNFVGVIGDDAPAKPAFTSLTTVTFNGTVAAGAITAGAFSQCTKLATVDFKNALAAKAVKAAAFGDGTNYAGSANTPDANGYVLTINYLTATATSVKNPFEDAAFSDDGAEGNYAKLVTSTAFAGVFTQADGETAHNTAADSKIYSLGVDAPAAPEKETPLKVATKEGSKYYYAKLYHGTNNYKIAKKQGDATIIVYTAYVDASDATIYMENGRIINGYYEIPATTPVIVKSTSSADVKVNTGTGAGTTSFVNPGEINIVGAANTTGLAIKDGVAPMIPYFLAPIADYGFLWSKFKDERILVGTTAGEYDEEEGVTTADFTINCPVIAAGARLNVVWLDGSEEATAIQAVKNVDVENNAIYNLGGQKVNAAYKGVVIKNGKKFIQK